MAGVYSRILTFDSPILSSFAWIPFIVLAFALPGKSAIPAVLAIPRKRDEGCVSLERVA
jgi:hypothetical protein